jgi:acetylornithine deacetylase/succinyl-diaminopimelate desuccinylase-like protein
VDIYPDPTVNKFHQDDERISIKSLTDNIQLFAHVLQLLIQANPSPVARD